MGGGWVGAVCASVLRWSGFYVAPMEARRRTKRPSLLPHPRPSWKAKASEEAREPSQLDLLLQRLPACVTKELADELAVNFCYCQVCVAGHKRLLLWLCLLLRCGCGWWCAARCTQVAVPATSWCVQLCVLLLCGCGGSLCLAHPALRI